MIQITLEDELSVEPGHRQIVIPDTDEGRALVQLLTGTQPLIQRGSDLLVPHDANVDERMMQLIDQLAHVRYQAPDLIQLTLKEAEE